MCCGRLPLPLWHFRPSGLGCWQGGSKPLEQIKNILCFENGSNIAYLSFHKSLYQGISPILGLRQCVHVSELLGQRAFHGEQSQVSSLAIPAADQQLQQKCQCCHGWGAQGCLEPRSIPRAPDTDWAQWPQPSCPVNVCGDVKRPKQTIFTPEGHRSTPSQIP